MKLAVHMGLGVGWGAGFLCVDRVGSQSGIWWLFGVCASELSNGNIWEIDHWRERRATVYKSSDDGQLNACWASTQQSKLFRAQAPAWHTVVPNICQRFAFPVFH